MTRVLLDPALQALLAHLTEPAELCAADGKPIGVYHPAVAQPRRIVSPTSREELERLRLDRTGRSLADIQRDHGMK